MLRICLIVAIVASLAAGAVTFFKVQDILVTTRTARDDWNHKYTDETAAHNKTKKTLKDTQNTLATTQKNLDQTKSDLQAANNKVEDLTKNNTDLTAKLEKTTADRDEAQQKLEAWRQVGLEPDQVKTMMADLEKTRKAKDALVSENKLLLGQVNDWQTRWDNYFKDEKPVILPAGLKGKIMAVDPKYDFVVLDIGSDQGAKARGEMLVDRNGKLLGKVRIETVQKDRCVANILPGWKRGEVTEGDEVLY